MKKNDELKQKIRKTRKQKPIFSPEYTRYKRKKRNKKLLIFGAQILILVVVIGVWELLAQLKVIDTFVMSCPSLIWKKIVSMCQTGDLFYHAGITLYEATVGFLIATGAGYLIAILLWWNDTLRRILDPYIVVLNSLPKIALGPLLIIWVGVGTKAILAMDVLIMIVISIISMLNAFRAVDENKILLLKSMGASKFQILFKLIIPNSICDFMSLLKINVGLTWVGTIMGEYLVSRAGLGFQIVYGGQVFDMDLIMSSTVVLCVLAGLMYFIVASIEKFVYKKRGK